MSSQEVTEMVLDTSVVLDNILSSLQRTEEKMHLPKRALKRLFISFLESSYPRTIEMINAVQKGDIARQKAEAHAIRGIAHSLNITEVSARCHAIEYELYEDPLSYAHDIRLFLEVLQPLQEEIVRRLEA